jgi:hypothetical protein
MIFLPNPVMNRAGIFLSAAFLQNNRRRLEKR